MENSVHSIYNNQNHNSITNIFLEELEISLDIIKRMTNIYTNYDSKIEVKNCIMDLELDLLKVNIKYLDKILSLFSDYKQESVENHKCKMLKLYDFILYDFKRLRIKYEEINEFCFSLDEENKYIVNIKNCLENDKVTPTKFGCLYLTLLNHYLRKILQKLIKFELDGYKILKIEKDKFTLSNNKLKYLCIIIFDYLFAVCDSQLELILNEINTSTDEKWSRFFKFFINKICSKYKRKNNTKELIINIIKNGVNSLISLITSVEDELIPNTKIIKVIFELFQNKLKSNSINIENAKINEIIYFSNKTCSYENFKLFTEKEGLKKNAMGKSLLRIRILTNQIIKINYENINLFENSIKIDPKMINLNFFGLLLKVSKDFLTPSYNVIIHIPGGGFFSQSSESHISYLTQWAKETESIIISFDYKLSHNNKYPILLDECITAYELIIKYSIKLFNFNINRLVIYSDSVGGLIALDIIKHSIKNNLRIPDAAVLVFPIVNIIAEESNSIHEEFKEFIDSEDHDLETPICTKLQDRFLENTLEDNMNDDRLNFFLTNLNLLNMFPDTLIISSSNNPMRDESTRLAQFLKENNVKVTFEQLVYYCNGFLHIPSLFDVHHKYKLECALNFIINIFTNDLIFKESELYRKETHRSDYSGSTICL